MKTYALPLLLSICVLAGCASGDEDDDLYPECTSAQRNLPAMFILNGREFEAEKEDTTMITSTDVIMTRSTVGVAAGTIYYVSISAPLDDNHELIIQLEYVRNSGTIVDEIVYSSLTISTTDTPVGTAEEINGNLYYAENVAFAELLALDCMVEGKLAGNLPQVSPEMESGEFSYDIFFRALD